MLLAEERTRDRFDPFYQAKPSEPGQILVSAVGVHLIERGFSRWLYLACGQVKHVVEVPEPNIIIQIPFRSSVIRTLGINRVRSYIEKSRYIAVNSGNHSLLAAKDVLAIYPTQMLTVWLGTASPFYQECSDGYLCLCGLPLYGGSFREDY